MSPSEPFDPRASAITESLIDDDASALPGQLTLVVAAGPDQGATLPLGPGTFLVGKAAQCDLRLTDTAVSRRHLQLAVLTDRIEIRDLGSKNGSYYLGARFEVIRVGAGAQVTIGTTALAVVAKQERELPLHPGDRFGRLLGQSVSMRRVFAALKRLAQVDASILIMGETGTGKDLAAQAVHAASPRAQRPFVVCDLGAMPASLIESELFGHVRGAFTGADRDRAGAFEQADGGSIFLDEIGELALSLQPRLLRLLEASAVKRLGEVHYRSFDVRVIAATNRDLSAEVQAQTFRADLFHRLAVAQVRIPPLRERLEDIPLLVESFVADLAERGGRRLSLPSDTVAALSAYSWPGNVRQLRNVIERAVALAATGASELRPEVLGLDGPPASFDEPVRQKADPNVPFKDAKDRLIHAWEHEYMTSLIDKCGGNIAQAARVAGIDRAHLYRLLRKHGMHKPGE